MNVFVACPPNVVTGGIELLHQVCAELNKHDGINAVIWTPGTVTQTIPDEYMVYGNCVADRNPLKGETIIFPEIWAGLTNWSEFAECQKIIYWESVDNYFPHTAKERWFKFGEGTKHISQGAYSTAFLEDVLNMYPEDMTVITDYINEDFLYQDISGKREKIVLYNPAKGMEYTEKIIAYMPDTQFIPIQGMKRTKIRDFMLHSMVYIDFGNFPGKDRLPREAGACGMCLVTGKQGSARFADDLDIPPFFKIGNFNYADLKFIRNQINGIMNCFEEWQERFSDYRRRIHHEKAEFQTGIASMVKRWLS